MKNQNFSQIHVFHVLIGVYSVQIKKIINIHRAVLKFIPNKHENWPF